MSSVPDPRRRARKSRHRSTADKDTRKKERRSAEDNDDDGSLWMPPKAKDRRGIEILEEEATTQTVAVTKQTTKAKIGAVLQSMDLVVDAKGFLIPRKAKIAKDEQTIDNEYCIYDDQGPNCGTSSEEDSTSNDGSSSEEEQMHKLPRTKTSKEDSLSSIPYSQLIPDDTIEWRRNHPKTPLKSPSRRHKSKGMHSFSTLETEAMTRTPSATHSRVSFFNDCARTPISTTSSLCRSPVSRRSTSKHHIHSIPDTMISPLPDEPRDHVGVVVAPSSLRDYSTAQRGGGGGTMKRSRCRRTPYSSPVISKSRIARLPQKMGSIPFYSPLKDKSGTAAGTNRSTNRSPSSKSKQNEPSNNGTSLAKDQELKRPPARSNRHFVPSNIEDLLVYTANLSLSKKNIAQEQSRGVVARADSRGSGRSSQGETLSTEGPPTLTDSTDRHTAITTSASSAGHDSSAGGTSQQSSSILSEHLERHSPTKSSALTTQTGHHHLLEAMVDDNGFPINSIQGTGIPHALFIEEQDNATIAGSSSLCSETGAVVVRTRKVPKRNVGR